MDFENSLDDLPVDPIKTQSHDELGREIPDEIDFWPTIARPMPVMRCVGRVRNGPNVGERCKKKAVSGAPVCNSHGAQLPIVREKAQARLDAARMMLIDGSEDAVDQILELMRNATAENIRLKAAETVLDRVGIRGGIEVTADVQVTDGNPAQALSERLSKLSEAAQTLAKRESELADRREEESRRLAIEAAIADGGVIEGEIVEE